MKGFIVTFALCLLVCLNVPQVKAVSTTCVVCEYMVVFAEEAIQVEGWNKSAVLDKLHGYCARLPSIVGTVCEGFLQTYGDQLIQELWNDTPADGVCTELGVCQFDQVTKKPAVVAPKDSDYQCELCDYTVGAVELFLMAEKYNETEILNELEGLCDIVPQELELECRAFILLSAPKIVEAMLANTPPEQVCASLSLCSSGQSIKKTLPSPRQNTLN